MCTICDAFTPYKTECDWEALLAYREQLEALRDASADAAGDPATQAAFFEGTDAAQGTSTPYSISAGDTFDGTLSSLGDRDWVAINVVDGQSYQIDLYGVGGSAVGDTYMRLYDSSGNYLGFDDDGGAGLASNIWFTAEYTGVVYVSAASWDDTETGDYQISVANTAGRTTFSNDQIADQLTDGYWTSLTRESIARSFDVGVGDTLDVHIGGLNADGQQLATWALEAWTEVSGLNFNIITAGVADASHEIVMDDNSSGASNSSSYDGSGNIIQSSINVSTSWLTTYGTTVDSYSFQTYMHEIGHALGLGHAGNYNGAATWNIDNEYLNDSWTPTVMSYFSQTENPTTSDSFGYSTTLMMADIIAIQNIYGTGVTTNAGDTVYGWNTTLTNYFGQYFTDAVNGTTSIYNGNNFSVFTLYDTGGTDTLDYSGSVQDNNLNMNEETYSDLSARTGNFSIARGVTLENAIMGTGSDTVLGNGADNDIKGGDGADSLSGAGGADTIDGGDGDDTMSGGAGADFFAGTGLGSGDTDTIEDFDGTLDVVDLSSYFADFSQVLSAASQVSSDLHVDLGGGATLILEGTTAAALTQSNTNTLCFCAGTEIATPEGARLVEALQIGDLVRTADGRAVPVLWMGRQTVDRLRHGAHMQPVRIRAGALGDGLPQCDLLVTADHGMVFPSSSEATGDSESGYVINASALVNGDTIDFVPMAELGDRFTVYHIETECHDVILAGGAPSETFIDAAGRAGFDNHQEYLDLYGAERLIPEMPLPRIASARLVPQEIKDRLAGAAARVEAHPKRLSA